MGSLGEEDWDRVNDLRDLRCRNSRARTGREKSRSDISEREVRVLVLGRAAYVERPLEVTPERLSRRSDFSGGRERRVWSLKAAEGNEETWRFWSEGRLLIISVNRWESIIPPGLQ